MKYLQRMSVDEYAKVDRYILGKKVSVDRVEPYDNYINRLVLGVKCNPEVPNRVNELAYSEGLYDYQIEDVLRMINCKGYLNRNKPGYGKTIETVMACRNLNAKSVLIVAPKSTLGQWEKAFKSWWPDRANDVVVIASPLRLEKDKIYLTNPERVVNTKTRNEFFKFRWDVLTVDEAHMIKNRDALRTKVLKGLCTDYRWALTGTPYLRNPDDLWSIFDFLNPQYAGGSYWNFVRYFCNVEQTFFGEEIKGLTKDPLRVKYLQDLLDLVSCYHPERITEHGKSKIMVELIMGKPQATAYKKVRTLVMNELPEDMTIPNGAVKVLRLMQLTSAPSIFYDRMYGVKFEWIQEFLENNPDEKIVVYSRFSEALTALAQYLRSKKIGCCMYTGKLSGADRDTQKQKFITDKNTRVMLGTIQAMGVGVDGLQQASHICVFLDKDFVPDINNQCEDRLNRIGQTQEVLCYYLDCRGTWDKHVTETNNLRISDIRRMLGEEDV